MATAMETESRQRGYSNGMAQEQNAYNGRVAQAPEPARNF